MKTRIIPAGLVAAALAGVFVGGTTLMDATMTRHDDVEAGSTLEVELTISMRSGAEAREGDIAEALVVMCQLEVRGGVVDDLETVGHGHYRFVMTPGLDEADRRQLTGCLQDMRIDHVLANVVSMRQRDPRGDDEDADEDD